MTGCGCELKPNFLFLCCLCHFLFDLETIGVTYSNLHLMTNICENIISSLAGNLNLGLSYLYYYICYTLSETIQKQVKGQKCQRWSILKEKRK